MSEAVDKVEASPIVADGDKVTVEWPNGQTGGHDWPDEADKCEVPPPAHSGNGYHHGYGGIRPN